MLACTLSWAFVNLQLYVKSYYCLISNEPLNFRMIHIKMKIIVNEIIYALVPLSLLNRKLLNLMTGKQIGRVLRHVNGVWTDLDSF